MPLQADGDIIVRNTQGDLGAIQYGMQQTQQDIYAATGSSQVRQEGQMHSSITTGRAVLSSSEITSTGPSAPGGGDATSSA